jgi:hypothetical protein
LVCEGDNLEFKWFIYNQLTGGNALEIAEERRIRHSRGIGAVNCRFAFGS